MRVGERASALGHRTPIVHRASTPDRKGPGLIGRGGSVLAVVLAAGLLAGGLAAPAAGQSTHVLVVTGLGGDPEYEARFADWGGRLREAALAAGVAEEHVVWLAERESLAPGVTGPARLDRVARELARVAERSSPGDLVLLVLFGHGSARNGESRINLPGPDLSAGELAGLLEPLAGRRVVVVNGGSASGGFIQPLAGADRVIITATRSPREAEATRFGGPFVEALEGAGADTDKDGRVSMLEAFEYARSEVARSFAEGGHLPTEHALLEDSGDGQGSLDPAAGPDGDLAARLALAPVTAAPAGPASPELRALLAERERLRAELDGLRAREGSMAEEAYRTELERLLLEIARTGRSIREAEASTGDGGAAGEGGEGQR